MIQSLFLVIALSSMGNEFSYFDYSGIIHNVFNQNQLLPSGRREVVVLTLFLIVALTAILSANRNKFTYFVDSCAGILSFYTVMEV
jgi:hypothetical protein